MSQLLSLDLYARHFRALLAALFLAGFALLLLSTKTGRGDDIITGDQAEHFEYARSLVATEKLPAEHIRFPIGVSMIGFPTYAAVALAERGLIRAGVLAKDAHAERADSLAAQIAFCVPLLLLSYIAFLANADMLQKLGFSDRIANPSILFWIVTTNVGFYVLKEPARSEGPTYALLSIWYWGLIRWFYRPAGGSGAWTFRDQARKAVFLGLVIGLAGIVRQQNILHALSLPLIFMAPASALTRARIRQGLLVVTLAAAISAVVFVTPWIAWYAADHRIVLMSYTDGHFNWLSPRPWLVLFVPGYHGLLLYHPAFATAIIGVVLFLRRERALRPAWLFAIFAQFYLISTWHWLSFGASIGHRGFFTIFPLLLPGFAAFAAWADARRLSRPLVGIWWGLSAANAIVTLLLLIGYLDPGWGLPANSGF